jgi:hypothetical protein
MTKCVKCKNNFGADVGMYNSPMGWVCSDCGESKPWLKSVRKEIKEKKKIVKPREFSFENEVIIGKYSINGKVLSDYVQKVDYLRRATLYSISRDDPLILQKALQAREIIHRNIFRLIGLPYHADTENQKSHDFNKLLDDWLTKTLQTSCKEGDGK